VLKISTYAWVILSLLYSTNNVIEELLLPLPLPHKKMSVFCTLMNTTKQ